MLTETPILWFRTYARLDAWHPLENLVIKIAVDTGPLHGPMTGVGGAVEGMVSSLKSSQKQIEVIEYVLSFRAKLRSNVRRLPYPAGLTIKTWGHIDWPRADRFVGPAQLIHGMNYVVPPSRLPRVVTVYDCWALRNPVRCSSVINHSMVALQRSIASGAIIHASSQNTADQMREMFSTAHIEMIHLGSPPPRATASNSDRPRASEFFGAAPFILAIGTTEYRKNYPMLIRAFAQLGRHDLDLFLVIAGSNGDDSIQVDRAIAELPAAIAARIVRTGRLMPENISWLYQHATVLAYPSLDEGFGFPLLEAMQDTLPIVASNRGSIPEIASEAAILVDPYDVEALADALLLAITDSSVRARLITAAASQLRKFSWPQTGSKLIDLYSRLVK